MQTYEYPLGVTFRASTPEHAAARVFGGRPTDYIATVQTLSEFQNWAQFVEVTDTNTLEFVGDIPIVEGN